MTQAIPAAGGLTIAEKRALIRRLSELAAQAGLSLNDANSPGSLAVRHEPRIQVQRPHLELIDDKLTGLLARPNGRLMIWTPSQVGKSTRVSRWFPFWWLTLRPQDRILLGSFASTLASGHGMAVRDLIRQYGAQYGLFIRPDESARSDWSLTSGGGMRSRGIRGGIQGQPMDLAIVDDPFADRADAESEVKRNAVWDWYSSGLTTRRSPGAREVVVMTRWHADDLCGRLLAQDGRLEDGGEWDVLHLPAIAMPEDREAGIYADPLGREPGEPLSHPKILDDDPVTWNGAPTYLDGLLAHWAIQKARLTTRDWNATAQGTPFDAEGALLTAEDIRERTRFEVPELLRRLVSVDPSGSGKAHRDTAGIIGGGVDKAGQLWWTHDRTAKMTSDVWSREACILAHEILAGEIVVETNFGGDQATVLIRQAWFGLQREGLIPETAMCPMVVAVTARVSKVLRAEPIAQGVKLGRGWFGPGLKELQREWQLWSPGSTYSPGRLDAAVHLATRAMPTITRGAKTTSQAGKKITEITASPGSIAAKRIPARR